ncbi:MAG: RNA 3'-terminal phosphate cyclase [Armatimonadetes bacterium]|nr:RNA 3'-terminal phosphate cyclase [Armatimonadota bacterium]
MLTIDGSFGEGGGQIVRTSVALAALTGTPVRLVNVRAGRPRPGLQAQHVAAVQAVTTLCRGELQGAQLNSTTFTFRPGALQPGRYRFDVGDVRRSAGAASLVLQTVLLPLAVAGGESHVTIRGGTHVPWSPPADYLSEVFLPTLARVGLRASLRLPRAGYYPQGGGELELSVAGHAKLRGLSLAERHEPARLQLRITCSLLPDHIPRRIAARCQELLAEADLEVAVVQAPADSPGVCCFLLARYGEVLAGFTALGARGKPSERVAEECVEAFRQFEARAAPVDRHLADQLILPLALADGESRLRIERITPHLVTNLHVIRHFLPMVFNLEGEGETEGWLCLRGVDHAPEKRKTC